jgi:hypothetical protein
MKPAAQGCSRKELIANDRSVLLLRHYDDPGAIAVVLASFGLFGLMPAYDYR